MADTLKIEKTTERTVHPARNLIGALRLPGDKSISHRALMLAAFARGRSEFQGLLAGEDVQSTARVLRQLGASESWITWVGTRMPG